MKPFESFDSFFNDFKPFKGFGLLSNMENSIDDRKHGKYDEFLNKRAKRLASKKK